MSKEELYIGREQTLVKHVILESYLERFAHIIGSHWDAITYVDCFSGPWNVQSTNFEDSSFSIALTQLRKARDTHATHGKVVRLRCFFLEKDSSAYAALREFVDKISDVEIECRNLEVESAIDDIAAFVRGGGQRSFPFIFIDPTGWSGFAIDKIAPLLKLKPGEVLINFMTGHIRRFIESHHEATRDSFESLFGSGDVRQQVQGLSGPDREDVLVAAYATNVKSTGTFDFVRSAIVLHPEKDRTHFHLIYATRNAKGVEVFKEAEKKAMVVMETARAGAQQRKREQRDGLEFEFAREALHDPAHYNSLRQRYISRAKVRLYRLFSNSKRVNYDQAWDTALQEPLVWESDLKDWVRDWIKNGDLRIDGLKPRERTPKRNSAHVLVWQAGPAPGK